MLSLFFPTAASGTLLHKASSQWLDLRVALGTRPNATPVDVTTQLMQAHGDLLMAFAKSLYVVDAQGLNVTIEGGWRGTVAGAISDGVVYAATSSGAGSMLRGVLRGGARHDGQHGAPMGDGWRIELESAACGRQLGRDQMRGCE